MKNVVDAGVILAVVIANAVIGFLQESRAEQAIESLAETMVSQTGALRGWASAVPAPDLVPGDRLVLQAGD